MKKQILFLVCAWAFSVPLKSQEYLDDIMLQSFGWDEYAQSRVSSEGGLYEFLGSRAGNLKALGFDMVWTPPPSVSTGGVGYFPTQLHNFSQTSWGSEAQMTKMLSNMNSRGIYPIADIVVNHRSGTTGWTDFTNPDWGCETICIDDEASSATYEGCRPSGAADTGIGFDGSRDLDHTNSTVQNGVKEYLSILKSKGFKGWRWDVAKGFSSTYFGNYIQDSQPYYSVGEYWDGNLDLVKSWVDGTYSGGANISGAFDFPLYYTLSSALAANSFATLNNSSAMPGLVGKYGYSEKAVTFVDNHDTFNASSAILGSSIPKAYAYILTHPGIPCVWAPHYYGGTYSKDGVSRTYSNNSALINKLMAVRKTNGIDAYSSVTIASASPGLYSAYIKKRASDAEPVVAMKIGSYSWTPTGTGWNLIVSGSDYSVWSKAAVNVAPVINIVLPSGSYANGSPQSVTITATDDSGVAPTIYYTTDGTEPTISSTKYSGAFSVSNTTTVKAVAFDNQNLSSGVAERNYNFITPSDIVIRFKPPTTTPNWPSPKIHYWNYEPANALPAANWNDPIAMSADSENPGWFKYTFPGVIKVSFLFRDGNPTGTLGVTQTGDITDVTEDKWYVWDATSSNFVRDVTLATSEASLTKANFELLDNPVKNGIAKFRFKNANNGVISVFDVTGKLIKNVRTSSSEGEQEIALNGLKSGVYIVQLKSDNGNSTLKMMVK